MFSVIEKQSFVGALVLRVFDLVVAAKDVVSSLLSFLLIFHVGLWMLTGDAGVFVELKEYVSSLWEVVFAADRIQSVSELSMQYAAVVKGKFPADIVLTFSKEQAKVSAFQMISLLMCASAGLPLMGFAGGLVSFVFMAILLPLRLLIDILQVKDPGEVFNKSGVVMEPPDQCGA